MTEPGFLYPSVGIASGDVANEALALLTGSTGANVMAGGAIQVGQTFDSRQWASYYLTIDAEVQTSPPTNYNQIEVQLYWESDLLNTVQVASDHYEFWANATPSVAFEADLGQVYIQDEMHGPYMRVTMVNNGPDNVSVKWSLFGTTRILSSPYVRQGSLPDGILASDSRAIPATGTITIPMPMAYGEAQWKLLNSGANPVVPSLDYHLAADDRIGNPVPAGTLQLFNVVLPKRAALLEVTGTVGDVVDNRVITQFNKN